MIVHTLRNRRVRALSLRMIARGSVVVCFTSLVLAGQMNFANAAPAPPATSALTMGGIMGILDIFNSRDPLRKLKPDQVYKTKYGNITGAEYERRVLQERVKAYEAAIRAGGTSRADWTTRKRARQVERKIRRDDDVTAVASGMMAAGDWEERAAAETVLKAAAEEKSWWSGTAGSSRSARPAFKKGMSSYRTPTKEVSPVRDSQGTAYLSPATKTPSPSLAPSTVGNMSRSSGPMPSLATMKPTTHRPVPVAAATPAVDLPTPAPTPSVEVPEVKMLTKPKPNIPAPQPKPNVAAPQPKPKAAEKAEKKTAQKPVPGNAHSEMSSKEKLRMAVFGEASEVAEPPAKAKE